MSAIAGHRTAQRCSRRQKLGPNARSLPYVFARLGLLAQLDFLTTLPMPLAVVIEPAASAAPPPGSGAAVSSQQHGRRDHEPRQGPPGGAAEAAHLPVVHAVVR